VPGLDDERFISMLSVPVLLGERLLGVLNVQSEKRRIFARHEIDFFAAIAAHLANIIEMTGLKRQLGLAEALRVSQEQYRQIVETAWEGIWAFDAELRTIYVNQRLCEMLGYRPDELRDRAVREFASEVTAQEFERRVGRTELQDGSTQFDGRFQQRDGSDLWAIVSTSPVLDGEGNFVEWLAMLTDVTQRKLAEDALKHQALHDALTDLPNRVLLEDRLAQALLAAQRQQSKVAFLLLDLDHFKEVNDSLGHSVGDHRLRQIGPRISRTLRVSDTVARLGGDEFAVLLPGADRTEAGLVAQKVVRALEPPFGVDGHRLHIGASLGVVVFPDDGSNAETLLRRADLAMYTAKRGGGGYELFVVNRDDDGSNRLNLVAELRDAIDRELLELHFQPKVVLATGQATEVEALVRWRHPRDGLLSPAMFIPLAEETGLIAPLSEWVLEAAIRQCRAWQDAGLALGVAVNLSMRNLRDIEHR